MCALEQISDEATSGDSTAKSRGLLRNISQFGFLLGLKAAICLFGSTDDLKVDLQLRVRCACGATAMSLRGIAVASHANRSKNEQCSFLIAASQGASQLQIHLKRDK